MSQEKNWFQLVGFNPIGNSPFYYKYLSVSLPQGWVLCGYHKNTPVYSPPESAWLEDGVYKVSP